MTEPREVETDLMVPDRQAALARLQEAKLLLHVCSTAEEAKTIRDQAEAIRAWAKARRGRLEEECTAAELRVWAERRIGELLPPPVHGAPGPGRGHRKPPPGETHFSRNQAWVFRQLASFPIERFEAALAELRDSGRPATTSRLLGVLREVPPAGMTPEAHAFSLAVDAVNQLLPRLVRPSNDPALRPDVREQFARVLPQVLALKNQLATSFRKERSS